MRRQSFYTQLGACALRIVSIILLACLPLLAGRAGLVGEAAAQSKAVMATSDGARSTTLPTLPLGDKKFSLLFEKGTAALTRQDFTTALRSFEELYAYSPKPQLLYYLGKVALGEQRVGAAYDLFRRYAESMGAEGGEPEIRAEVAQLLQSPREAGCEVTVQGENGALLSIDGRIAGTLPLSLPLMLPAGVHNLVLEKSKRRVQTQVNLIPRRQAEVRFTLMPPLALLTMTPGVMLAMRGASLDPQLATLVRRTVADAVAQQNAVLLTPETQTDTVQQQAELLQCLQQSSCQAALMGRTTAQFVLDLEVQVSPAATIASATPTAKVPAQGGIPNTPPMAQGDDAKKAGGASSSSFVFGLKLVDVDVGAVSISGQEGCTDCTAKRAMAQLNERVQEILRQSVVRQRGTLSIGTDPAGATVNVNGRQMGATPYLRDSFVGSQEVELTKPGFQTEKLSLAVTDGQITERQVALTPIVTQTPSLRPTTVLKWTLLGVGIASLIGGGTLLGLNGHTSCTDTTMSCGQPFEGRPAGIALLSIGALAVGSSVFLFVQDIPSAPPAAAPSVAGMSLIRRF